MKEHRSLPTAHAAKWFLLSAGVILIATAMAKIWSATGHEKLLDVADPITGIYFRHLMMLAGIVELLIGGVCLVGRANAIGNVLVAWLATIFIVYRLGLLWLGWHKPCNCLGNLSDALHISPQLADDTMMVVLAYLAIGSYGILLWNSGRLQWFGSKKMVESI